MRVIAGLTRNPVASMEALAGLRIKPAMTTSADQARNDNGRGKAKRAETSHPPPVELAVGGIWRGRLLRWLRNLSSGRIALQRDTTSSCKSCLSGASLREFLLVRPAGRTYLEVKVLYSPGKGKS